MRQIGRYLFEVADQITRAEDDLNRREIVRLVRLVISTLREQLARFREPE